jgi:outer membrane protein OmpA-like peptidoglycan-associated protein
MVFSQKRIRALLSTALLAYVAASGCGYDAEHELAVKSAPIIAGCAKHTECEDGNPCTQNLCAVGVCAPALPVLGCCFDGACNAEGGAPAVQPIDVPAGCSTDEQCEDANPCTQNVCAVGLCAVLPVLGCCFHGECGGAGEGGAGNSTAGAGNPNSGGNGNGGKDGSGNSAGEGATGSETAAGSAPVGGAGEPRSGLGDGAAANQAGAASENDGQPGGDDTVWVMQGGSCSVGAPGGKRLGYLSLLGFALAVAVVRRRGKRRAASALLLLPLLGSARANAAGFAQDAYTAPGAPADLMWSERAASDSGHLRPFARLTLGVTDDPLVLVDANDSSRELRVVDDQVALYGAVGFGFFRRAHLALLMPFYLQSSAVPVGANDVRGTRAGDFGVDGRFTILDRQAPLELALAATLRLPTGAQAAYASDGSATIWPRALLSKQLGTDGSLVNLSVGPVFRPSTEVGDLNRGSQLRFTAGALFALTRVVGVTCEAATSTTMSDPFEPRNTPIEGALGGRLTFSGVVLGTSLGAGLSKGIGAPDARWLAMIALPGTIEEPNEPAAFNAPVDDDTDRDAIRGAADLCPGQAEDQDGFEDQDGCPEVDNDRDGILDAADKCPTKAEDRDGFEDQDGCPEVDNDHDGTLDAADKCPDKAEDLDHWQDEDGCPEEDNDQDGILDLQDKCPNEAETKNGVDDDDGCPDLLRVEDGQIRTLEPVYFDNAKATIQPRSGPLLDEMAQLISSRPDLGVILIEGHTDSRGSATYNLKLSKDRAASVRLFLIQKGVSESRLSSAGLGSTRPVADNKLDAGRAKNRRVEFHFGGTPVEVTSP